MVVETFLMDEIKLLVLVLEYLSQIQNISQIKVLSHEITIIVMSMLQIRDGRNYADGSFIFLNIPACHLQLFSTLLHR